jgi:peptidoglycan/xylan/chitin deacetylase (PgdA/CDA1 family)
MKCLTLMYHYVRPTNYNKINVNHLDFKKFQTQLNTLERKKIKFLDEEILNEILVNKKKIKQKLCWLTFDDGYHEHYEFVFPELASRKICGFFFPSASSIQNKSLLDVNKIHIILSNKKNVKFIIEAIKNHLNDDQLFDKYWREIEKHKTLDKSDIRFVKHFFQYKISNSLLLDKLIQKLSNNTVSELSKKYYLNFKQIKEMKNEGMIFGGHGYHHKWLGNISYDQQLNEIKQTKKFLKKIKTNLNSLIMCYPHGSYNNDTIKILKKEKFLCALKYNGGINNFKNRFELNRIDIKDFKKYL